MPVLQYHFNWKTLSAMAGVTWWNFYFRLFPGAIRSPQIIEFLSHLLRHIPGRLLIVWDGLPGHRSRVVWNFIQEQRGRLWSHWKQHELPNFCATTFGPTEPLRTPCPPPHALPTHPGLCLLGTGRTVSSVTILCKTQ